MFRSGTVTSPECNVDSTDAPTIYKLKFAATHGAFFAIILLLAAVACCQGSCGSGAHRKRQEAGHARRGSDPRQTPVLVLLALPFMFGVVVVLCAERASLRPRGH